MFSKRTLILSAFMMITTVTILLVALSALTTTNIIYQQQEALATQGDTSQPTSTDAACGEVVEGLVELNSDLDCSGDGLIVGADETTVRLNDHTNSIISRYSKWLT